MINGAHVMLYSRKPELDRALFRDVLGLPGIDAGGGWLIFGLPPSEVAMHDGKNGTHELYLTVDDVHAFVAEMKQRKVAVKPIREQRWGLVTEIKLPGGGKLGVYQPLHARPHAAPQPGKAAARPRPKARAKAKAKAKPSQRGPLPKPGKAPRAAASRPSLA